MFNTPPTYAWYLVGLVLRWVREQGGVPAMQAAAERQDRSLMNVPFTLADPGLDAAFLAGAEERRLLNLRGHRSVGGMRASLYNAVPEAAVDALVEYMADFETERG